ncbi:ral guanine nucleotide dissociation stimulator-like isoform X2 [Mirounga leonina]|uniref:ral guanine nucleotide dissociation stimulator-like isoform X2 n=1 Tax=Mirounga leonina TaxID=9715 RepID=UPI00156C3D71|nr:ral guanine nucleotide dissociation stimulator-like isoform X2 [Mirounga leonina]
MPITPGARLRRQRPQPHLHIPGHVHGFCHHPEVLDLFFTTYGGVLSTSDELGGALEQRNMAISSILGTWLDQYPQDFFQPPEFPCLNVLLTYMGLHVPGSDLERRAQRLLSQLQPLEPPSQRLGVRRARGARLGPWRGPGGPRRASLHRVRLGREQCVVPDPHPHGLRSRETSRGSDPGLSTEQREEFPSLRRKGRGEPIRPRRLPLLGATAPAPERDPEGAQEPGPAPAVAPAVAWEPPRAEPSLLRGLSHWGEQGRARPRGRRGRCWSERSFTLLRWKSHPTRRSSRVQALVLGSPPGRAAPGSVEQPAPAPGGRLPLPCHCIPCSVCGLYAPVWWLPGLRSLNKVESEFT